MLKQFPFGDEIVCPKDGSSAIIIGYYRPARTQNGKKVGQLASAICKNNPECECLHSCHKKLPFIANIG